MAFDRTTLIQEPGLVTFGSAYFYSVGPITVDLVEERNPIPSDAFGDLEQRVIDRRVEIKFTPIGELEALSVLFPHGSKTLGASLFPSSDAACVIDTPSGKRLTVHNAAITSQPTLICGHDKTLFGEVTITGLIRKDYEPNDAAAYFTYATGQTYPGDANISLAAIKTLGYKAAWGASSPWDEFFSQAGFTLTTDISTEAVMVDGHGTVDMRVSNLVATVAATPVGISVSDIITKRAFQGSGNQLGQSRVSGDDLIITNALGSLSLHVQLYGAMILDTPLRFSNQQIGNGEVVWQGTREFATGTPVALYYVGTSAPA
jgi:hypothetical protein